MFRSVVFADTKIVCATCEQEFPYKSHLKQHAKTCARSQSSNSPDVAPADSAEQGSKSGLVEEEKSEVAEVDVKSSKKPDCIKVTRRSNRASAASLQVNDRKRPVSTRLQCHYHLLLQQ